MVINLKHATNIVFGTIASYLQCDKRLHEEHAPVTELFEVQRLCLALYVDVVSSLVILSLIHI